MAKHKYITTRTAGELAKALGLTAHDAMQFELRSQLVDRIERIVSTSGQTHSEVARAARTSRTRLTAILNRNLQGVSTDLLLRILFSLGYRARLTIRRDRKAA